MAEIGQFALAAAFVASIVGLVAGIRALVRRSDSRLASAMAHLTFAFCTAAVIALLISLLKHDFQIKYVFENTDKALSTLYLVAALWGGQSGGLLLWASMLAGLSSLAIWRLRRTMPDVCLPATVLLLFLTCFFVALVVYAEDSFDRSGLTPADGSGLNPLLQTVEMLFHPPTLYLGFAGFAVPFAIFAAGLWARRLDAALFRSIRAWMLFSWGMLTVGIVLGSEWAYVELGWGGFWGWDPVENASLLPWLTGAAALHALVLSRRSGMLKTTSFILVAVTFALCVFGAWLTRSGIMASMSVHAFSGGGESLWKNPLFSLLLGLIASVGLFSLLTIVKRWELLLSDRYMKAFFSREVMFLGCVIAFLATAAAVFCGTMLPVFADLVGQGEVTWGKMTYNITTVPFGLALLAMMAIGISLERQIADLKTFRGFLARFIPAAIIGAACGLIAHFAFRIGDDHSGTAHLLAHLFLFHFVPPLPFGFAGMAGAAALIGVGIETHRRRQLPSLRRLGAPLAHLGVVAMFLGMAGSAYVISREASFEPEQSIRIGRYKVTYHGLEQSSGTVDEVKANLTFSDGDRSYGRLNPAIRFYKSSSRRLAEVSFRPGLREDLYAILHGYDGDKASLELLVNPLITWLWIGGGVLVLGTIAAALPRKGRQAQAAPADAESRAEQPAAFCPECGSRISYAGAKFCPHCGSKFEEQPVEA